MNHSNRSHYDVVQDVCVSYLKQSDDIHSHSNKKETKRSQSTCHREQRQTTGMIAKDSAKKRKHESQHNTTRSKKPRLVEDPGLCELTEVALKGFLAEHKLGQRNEENETDLQYIQKGKMATKTVCEYVDSLLSTWNPEHPCQNNWSRPIVHPCKQRFLRLIT